MRRSPCLICNAEQCSLCTRGPTERILSCLPRPRRLLANFLSPNEDYNCCSLSLVCFNKNQLPLTKAPASHSARGATTLGETIILTSNGVASESERNRRKNIMQNYIS